MSDFRSTFFIIDLCAPVVRVLATDPEVSGFIPGTIRFSEKQWVWTGVHSAS
jgi:hypothetical protein